MFTGIVEEVGVLLDIAPTGLVIRSHTLLQDVAIKDSVAVDGTCLTVTERGVDWFRVDTMPETLRRTRFGSLQVGDTVNLERSLAANGRIGGHMVQGHIEATVPIIALEPDGIEVDMTIALPPALQPYILAKGFIAVNGVSLTVVECHADRFSIALIPYTREHTNLGSLPVGALLNLETDIVGRYVAQFVQRYSTSEV
ncbi:MAG TPA: riboflavin synthase [Ktedonobacteraceae bacterium]|jgi:riboflavin synthase|nr:riboflavin synthase [Ktedonobacteraceae bacterium]